MRTSIIIPSMGRKDRLLRCIHRTMETAGDNEIEFCISLDADMESFSDVAALCRTKVCEDTKIVTGKISEKARLVVVHNVRRVGAIAAWNQGLGQATGDILVFFNDDCYPEDGWLDAALKAHKEELDGYGLVGFNAGYQDGNKLAVQYLFDRQFCIDVLGGVMAYPIFNFYYNDTVSNDLAKRANNFYWCEEAVVQHQHWSRPGVKKNMDDLDRENQPFADKDKVIYENWKAHGFPMDMIKPVLKKEETA